MFLRKSQTLSHSFFHIFLQLEGFFSLKFPLSQVNFSPPCYTGLILYLRCLPWSGSTCLHYQCSKGLELGFVRAYVFCNEYLYAGSKDAGGNLGQCSNEWQYDWKRLRYRIPTTKWKSILINLRRHGRRVSRFWVVVLQNHFFSSWFRVADGRHLNKLSRRVQTHTLQLHTVAISKCLSWQCKQNVNGTLALLYTLPFSVLQYFLLMLLDFCCFESVNLVGYSNSLKRILFIKKTGLYWMWTQIPDEQKSLQSLRTLQLYFRFIFTIWEI